VATYKDVNIVGHFVDLHDYPTTGELVLQIGDGTAIPLPIGPPGPRIVSVAQTAGRFVWNLSDGTSVDGGPLPATVKGDTGGTGAQGAPSTVPGPVGPASTVPGPAGPQGTTAGIAVDTDGVPYYLLNGGQIAADVDGVPYYT